MSEIRSTLDIIMEKAKGLTATDEEIEAFRRKEMEGKIRGALQRFLDGLMGLDELKEELGVAGRERQDWVREILREECLGRIDPEKENTSVLNVLEELVGMDIRRLHQLLSEFRVQLEKSGQEYEKQTRLGLKNLGISGSAVIHSEHQCRTRMGPLSFRFEKRIPTEAALSFLRGPVNPDDSGPHVASRTWSAKIPALPDRGGRQCASCP